MDWTIEVISIPVSDIDRAKAFYAEAMAFHLDVDRQINESFRVVQLTPPGSGCSIFLMLDAAAAGTMKGMQIIVPDIIRARDELVSRGVDVKDFFHFDEGVQSAGPSPTRSDYETFLELHDPDGNHWLLQEVPSRAA